MAAMFIFTILMNLFAWAAFTVTDIVFGGYSFVNMIVLAEWFVMPMAASAIYRAVTSHKGNDEQHDKAMYMLMWFVVSTGISGLVCRIREMTIWYDLSKFNSFDYPSYILLHTKQQVCQHVTEFIFDLCDINSWRYANTYFPIKRPQTADVLFFVWTAYFLVKYFSFFGSENMKIS